MKKRIIIVAVSLIIILLGCSVYVHFSKPDGSTIESREELIGDQPKESEWNIAIETKFEGFLISGIYSTKGKSGIAVFKPIGNGKYQLYSREWRENDEIIISGCTINGAWYDLI